MKDKIREIVATYHNDLMDIEEVDIAVERLDKAVAQIMSLFRKALKEERKFHEL